LYRQAKAIFQSPPEKAREKVERIMVAVIPDRQHIEIGDAPPFSRLEHAAMALLHVLEQMAAVALAEVTAERRRNIPGGRAELRKIDRPEKDRSAIAPPAKAVTKPMPRCQGGSGRRA
jgi:hypothetical protein